MEFHSHKTPRHRSFFRPSIAARKHVSRTDRISVSVRLIGPIFLSRHRLSHLSTSPSLKIPTSHRLQRLSVVVAVRPPHLVSRRRPRRRRRQGPRQLDGEEAASSPADPAQPSAPLDHLAQPLHALLEAVARDGARRLQVPLPPVPQVAQAQLRLQLVGLQRRG